MVNYTCGVASTKNSSRRSSNSQLTLLRKQTERYRLRRLIRSSRKALSEINHDLLSLLTYRHSLPIERTIEVSRATHRNSTVSSRRNSGVFQASRRCRTRLREESRQPAQANRSEAPSTEGTVRMRSTVDRFAAPADIR